MSKTVNLQSEFVDSKDLLFDLFKKNKIKSVTVNFDGSGDSGQIDYIGINGKMDHPLLKQELVGTIRSNGRRFNGTTFVPIIEEAKNVEEVIESVCYETLETVASGWENNDGASGTFMFDMKNRKIHLEFNQRYTEVETTEYDI